MDAGSSGTRIHIYKWLNSDKARKSASAAQLHKLPEIDTKKDWTKKIHPGISTFGERPHDVGPDHLQQLLSHALEVVPRNEVPNTPLFLLATAGMRILPKVQRESVLAEVCAYTRKTTEFQLPDCDLHVQVIPGETEGLYGWIAANYLLGGFDNPEGHRHGKDHHTYGFLDMGGASAQIAFAPNATEAEQHANDLTLLRLRTIDGAPLEYKVFVTTWLGFGVNQARQRYVKSLLESSPGADEYPDPCLPSHASIMVDDDGKVVGSGSKKSGHELVGTGIFSECLSSTYPLLEKEKECLDAPCLINGQHTPAIDFDINHFVGVSEYYHTTHEIFKMALKDDDEYDFKTYQKAVDDFCSQSWKDIKKGIKGGKWGHKVDEQTAQEVCFKSSWLINVLHDGIGVPRVGLEDFASAHNITKAKVGHGKKKTFLNPFQAVNKINGKEVSWTLGKMVLYASSEVPPPSADPDVLAVGFGSNVPGIPADFQFPGGSYTPLDPSHDALFAENPRRIPGFLIFVLIICLVGYITCLRPRRQKPSHAILPRHAPSSSSSSRRLPSRLAALPSKFFGFRKNTSPSYERVLDSADVNPSAFELASLASDDALDGPDHEHSSDDSEGAASASRSRSGSRVGRTSGWATPRGAEPADPARDVVGQGVALGLGLPERGGLMARTESRERMAGGWRSRAGSPVRRGKSGLGHVRE